MNKECCMIEVAFSSEEEALNGINILLYKKLASSCQIITSKSKWLWNGKIEECQEYLVFIKTSKEKCEDIWKEIRAVHSYDLFEFATFDMSSCDANYLNWISGELE